MLVLDCSVLMEWVLPDEDSEYAKAVRAAILRHEVTVLVSPLFFIEATNVLDVMLRRKRMERTAVDQARDMLPRLPVTVDMEGALLPAMERVWSAMQHHGLTAYDASYLELALRRGLPLATLDKALRTAAIKEKIFFNA